VYKHIHGMSVAQCTQKAAAIQTIIGVQKKNKKKNWNKSASHKRLRNTVSAVPIK